MPPNALSRESTLDSAIKLLDTLNRATRGRGTVRLHLPPGAGDEAASARPGEVWQGFSYDYALPQEAEQSANVLQAVYSAWAESRTGPARLEVERYGPVLVVWIYAPSAAQVRDLVDALVRRLRSFE